MKYCLKCGSIISDKSTRKDNTLCPECGTILSEDNMTGEQFEALSEAEKEVYTESLYNTIKQSPKFDESLSLYGNPAFYFLYWFDKYEQLMPGNGWRAGRYETEEEQTERLNKMYGPESEAYQRQVAENYANAAATQQATNVPKCPICSSTSLSKISAMKKAGKIGLFGIFGAGDIGKTWKCNNCGSKF